MEIVINTLFAFIFMSLFLKLSFWKIGYTLVFGSLLGAFVFYIYPFATEQSQVTFNAILNNPKTMGDMTVFVILEATLLISYALLLYFPNKNKNRWIRILKFYPGLLVLPILFYILTQSMFTFTGVDFFNLALIISVIVTIGIPLFSVGVKWLFKEEEQRQEILLLVNIFIIILGLIATANGKMTYVNEGTELNYTNIVIALIIFAVLIGLGIFLNKLKWIISNKKLKKL